MQKLAKQKTFQGADTIHSIKRTLAEKIHHVLFGYLLKKYSSEIANQLFLAILNRQADEEGLLGYKESINKHRSLIPAIKGILQSDEFAVRAANLAGPTIIDALYLGIKNQNPPPQEREKSIELIRSGTGLVEVISSMHAATQREDWGNHHGGATPMIMHWVHSQLRHWEKGVKKSQYESFCHEIAGSDKTMYCFCLNPTQVDIVEKNHILNNVEKERIQSLLTYFQGILRDLDLKNPVTIAVCINDYSNHEILEYPIFAFDKIRHHEKILIPDTDYLMSDKYQLLPTIDPASFLSKKSKAVFAGATTGSLVTKENIKNKSIPRVRSAQYFQDCSYVDFLLTNICQHDDKETLELVESLGICDEPWTWDRQLENKFLISMDGNGTTWSRMVKALYSNSALIKYESPRVQFYYESLVPWLHYIPVIQDEEVVTIVKNEVNEPGKYQFVATAGREFANRYLRKEVVDFYMIQLLKSFESLLR